MGQPFTGRLLSLNYSFEMEQPLLIDTTEDGSRHAATVWFDAQCPLCVREIALMQRLDTRGAIEFVTVQDAGLCPVDRQTLLARLHARGADGEIVSGAAAFAIMWREIPQLRLLGLAAKWPPLLMLLELSYCGFLRVRPALQRLVKRLDR